MADRVRDRMFADMAYAALFRRAAGHALDCEDGIGSRMGEPTRRRAMGAFR
ncbi:MAG: hypothetical protein RIC16_04900 [Rhodospirillales bacterium]